MKLGKKEEKDSSAKKPDLKKIGKTAAHTAAGAALAGSVFLGSLFSSPSEVMADKDAPASAPPAIVQVEEMPPEPEFAAEPSTPADVTEKKRTLSERIKDALLRLPVAVRAIFVMPMWAVGYAIIWLVSALVTAAGMPILGPIIRFIIGAAAVIGLVILGEKLLFPDVPIKQLLSKRNLIPLCITAGAIALSGTFGSMLWKDKPYITALIDVGFAAAYLLSFALMARQNKKAGGKV